MRSVCLLCPSAGKRKITEFSGHIHMCQESFKISISTQLLYAKYNMPYGKCDRIARALSKCVGSFCVYVCVRVLW